jgi:tetratricopeptide (TPR) repeat protein
MGALLLAIGPDVCLAADAGETAQAKQHYALGVKHYDLAEYDPALREFKAAYLAAPDPAFLFNIAQCHRKLGNFQDAITFYRTFLRRAPEAPNRPEIERRIADLQREIDAGRSGLAPPITPAAARAPALAAPPPPPGPRPPEIVLAAPASAAAPPSTTARPFYRNGWLWAIAGVVVAGAVAAVLIARAGNAGAGLFCPDCAATAGVREP